MHLDCAGLPGDGFTPPAGLLASTSYLKRVSLALASMLLKYALADRAVAYVGKKKYQKRCRRPALTARPTRTQ